MADIVNFSGFRHELRSSSKCILSEKLCRSSPAHSRSLLDIPSYNGYSSNGSVAQFKCQDCRRRLGGKSQFNDISAAELYQWLRTASNLNNDPDFLLVDTRDSAAYSAEHIVSSLSFNCHSKMMARRAIKMWGELFADCDQCPAPRVSSTHSCIICDSQETKKPRYSFIVLYNEDGEHLNATFQGAPSSALPPLHLFVNHLLDSNNNVLFLQGGLKSFLNLSEAAHDFVDAGNNVMNLASTCRQTAPSSAESRVNIVAVSSASNEINLSHIQKMLAKQSNLELNATFPPKSVPMPRLVLSSLVIKTPEVEKLEAKSSLGDCSDVFGAVISKILPHLYLGNARDAQDKNLLETLRITHILNVTDCVPTPWENTFVYLRLPAVDNDRQNLKPQFNQAFEFIDKAIEEGGTVLVHCQAGVSRSATIVIAYILRHSRDLTVMQALEKVQKLRPIVAPNLNFMGQLQAYYRELRGYGSSAGTIPRSGSHDSLCGLVPAAPFTLEEPASPVPSLSPFSGSSEEATTPLT